MTQRWDSLSFLHWRYEPADVQRLLPEPLVVDAFDGSAWVGLVPFEMQRVRPPWLPTLGPWSRFCETNVRTYVVGPDGDRGVYFFSLDAAQRAPVVTARLGYRLPYHWSHMAIRRSDAEIAYTCLRRWPRPAGAVSRIRVAPGAAVETTPLDRFLTARWCLYQSARGRVRRTDVHHEPWPLAEATVTSLDDELVAASGLRPPAGPALVRYSPGIDVRIGYPRRV